MEENSASTDTSINRWVLTAQIVEMSAMRFSPAGIPAMDCVLEHQSTVVEAGILRKVQARLKAVAIGPVAEQLSQQPLGLQARFEGFLSSLARTSQSTNRSSVVFHIQSFVNSNTR